jgi:hypothetical protein
MCAEMVRDAPGPPVTNLEFPKPTEQAMPRVSTAVIGLNIGKNTFHVFGLECSDREPPSQLPPCLIGIACVCGHHLSRQPRNGAPEDGCCLMSEQAVREGVYFCLFLAAAEGAERISPQGSVLFCSGIFFVADR